MKGQFNMGATPLGAKGKGKSKAQQKPVMQKAPMMQQMMQPQMQMPDMTQLFGIMMMAKGSGKGREECKQLVAQMLTGGPVDTAMGGETKETAGTNWKSKLHETLGKHAGKTLTKTDIMYETTNAEDGQWVAAVASPYLKEQYWADASAPSKKAAENLAAKAAMMYEFPGEATELESGAAANPTEVSWKSKLTQFVSKRAGRSLTKGELAFEVVEAQGGGYTATLVSELLKGSYYSEEACEGKKQAEHAAAKMAIQHEFPQEWAAIAPSSPAAPQKGTKRKAAAEPMHEKSALCHSLTLLMNRSLTKEDIVYTTEEHEGPPKTYSSVVSLPKYDASAVYQSPAPAPSKSEAEKGAAGVAVAALQHLVAPVEEERKAKKAKLNKEKLDKLKEATAAKKAAKQAAAGAA